MDWALREALCHTFSLKVYVFFFPWPLVTEWHSHSLTPTTSCGWGAEMTLMVVGLWLSRVVIKQSLCIWLSIRNNDVRSTCVEFPCHQGPVMTLLVAGRRLSLTQPPITDHLHWPHSPHRYHETHDQWPHIVWSGDPGSWDTVNTRHRRHWLRHLACKHLIETLNIHRIFRCNLFPLVGIN